MAELNCELLTSCSGQLVSVPQTHWSLGSTGTWSLWSSGKVWRGHPESWPRRREDAWESGRSGRRLGC